MKVILKEDVKNLGIMGSIVDVANGYGRNYLIPRNLAVEANPNNLNQMKHEKNIIDMKSKKIIRSAEDLAKKISGITLSIEEQSGEDDKLFGSVTAKDIAEGLAKQGVEIEKRKINLEEPIKRLGTYTVQVKVLRDISANVTVEVKKAAAATEA